jgi:hypothetical protein
VIPLLQFDPATLTLWYDTQLLATTRASREIGLALHYAIDGREDWLKCLIRQQSDPWVRTRCATVASSVWHEKRHFLDFILTNYGAMRVRQFFQCYVNARNILSLAKNNGSLLLPLDRNLDPQRCAIFGVSVPGPELLAFASWIRSSKRMLLDDRRPANTAAGCFEIGGEAILECIAYHVQLGKAHRVFGGDLSAKIQRDNPGRDTVAAKYQWANRILISSRLMNVTIDGEHDGETLLRIDDNPLIPILYAALAGRFHRQQQTQSTFTSSYLPAERLVSIVAYLDECKSKIASMGTLEAWAEVNQACKAIFGRTVIEEIEADYEKERDLIAHYRNAELDDFAVSAYEDFHSLRGRLISLLKEDPEVILDQASWSDRLVNKTRPFVVAAAPAGVIGLPPDGFMRLAGYAEPSTDFDQSPDFRWWWTAMRVEPDSDGKEEIFRLSDQSCWCEIASDFAPLSKLMIDGNRMRAMLGPELVSTKTRIERQTGVSLIVDSLSKYPEENFDMAQWYFLTGQDSFRCQVTHQIVRAPHGRLIAPWEFRRRPAIRIALLKYLGAEQEQRMLRAIWRDWSPWLVCDEIGELFDDSRIDHDIEL